MQLSFSTAIATLAAVFAVVAPAAAQSCSEATRFGVVTVSPTTLSPGDTFTVTANFSCAVQFGVNPQYTDYYIEVPVNNNGYEPPILLARRTLNANSETPLFDQFTTQLPYAVYFNASYVVMLDTTYPVNGTNGTYSVVGGVETVINIL
ncbi:hypothetical protein DFJ58DRAFT_87505 [Suillus subalutaceus]|uniref:uncharacterized protein n=1 Tax=Suillus subalutaceus TaxID=48586 RepID=UPI001B8644DA|nr:uncharacterized protein DFJ58DRAFT_87505 [Suillus subalutaceus]KAG1840700.1 hypothetical protein DFJ58DRAFT_87505 [Suillus subalutaceus]KAG1883392.1 hypothetical protein F4604DRAFT_287928 [Suillus subluteus]